MTNHLKLETQSDNSSPSFHVSSRSSDKSPAVREEFKPARTRTATVKSSEEEVIVSCVNKAAAIKESMNYSKQNSFTQIQPESRESLASCK